MKKEIKRALINKCFICICLYGIIIAILHSYESISEYNKSVEGFIKFNSSSDIKINPYAPISNAFTLWIGCNSESKFSKLFYILLPLIAVLPYSWSYCSDIKGGQSSKLIKDIGEYNYHLSKYIAVFVSSGLAVTIPLLLDFLTILLFVPAIFPDSVFDIYYGIFSNNFMADIFYEQPFLYVLIFLFIDFVFCGLFGCIGHSISTFIKSKIIAVALPSILVILVEYLKNLTIKDKSAYYLEFSPLSFLCPFKSYTTNWIIIIFESAILLLITYYISVARFKKKDNKQKIVASNK